MFDETSVALMNGAPALEGLDLTRLPQELTKDFATIVAIRIRLRQLASGDAPPEELMEIIGRLQRLAVINEAFVAAVPDREDRAAAAFVAATAHQVRYAALDLLGERASALTIPGVASDIAAALLFLIAGRSADATQMARAIPVAEPERIEGILVQAVKDLASGSLVRLLERAAPSPPLTDSDRTSEEDAASVLWTMLFVGIQGLARRLVNGRQEIDPADQTLPISIFRRVRTLSAEAIASGFEGPTVIHTFPGPLHLASLLIAVAIDLPLYAMIDIVAPPGVDSAAWLSFKGGLAGNRPYLWPNHLEALSEGYLQPGVSSVVSFPTGAGKSTLAELKIAAARLQNKRVVYLAPTLALVDQISSSLRGSFPEAKTQFDADPEPEELPSVAVMTPERCLTLLSFSPDLFDEAGLLVFDECHLIHPKRTGSDRRAIDAMMCLLNFINVAPNADVVLLSAMMSNAADIAEWVRSLTQRPCIPLSLGWKPTRQARGCTVYDLDRIRELTDVLQSAPRTKGGAVTAATKRQMSASPAAIFCLRQTWQTNALEDYAVLALSDDQVELGTSTVGPVHLTGNANIVAASIAAKAAAQRMKTLVFSQTIRSCGAVARGIGEALPARTVSYTPSEEAMFAYASEELGGEVYTYCQREALACTHHGLLLPAERHLHESLFSRPDGIDAIVATSTLAQGMNLASQLVVIAGDHRFDPEAESWDQLEAHDLLNAAGRAGRAGEGAEGVVIIVPSKVVGMDLKKGSALPSFYELKNIFAKSDQCLAIEDPVEMVLDRIFEASNESSEDTEYFVGRLPVESGSQDEAAKRLLARSFAAFKKGKQGDQDWIATRIDAALAKRRLRAPDPLEVTWLDILASSTGLSVQLIQSLHTRLKETIGQPPSDVYYWVKWFLDWLSSEDGFLNEIVRPSSLEVFGKRYTRLPEANRIQFVIAELSHLLPRWVRGETLHDLSVALDLKAEVGKCESARSFARDMVRDLAYGFYVLVQVYKKGQYHEAGQVPKCPLGFELLGRAVREGFDDPDAVALQYHLGNIVPRVVCHRKLSELWLTLEPGTEYESLSQAIRRVGRALDASTQS